MPNMLVVRKDVERRAGVLRVREEDLRLSADGSGLVLNCYFENYQPQESSRVLCSYQVSLAAFTHWMISYGELRMQQS